VAEMIAVRRSSPAAVAARAPRRSAHEVRPLDVPAPAPFGRRARPPS